MTVKSLIVGLPNKPGVYKFYDKAGELLYIGKAVDIKKRVRQHFDRPHSHLLDSIIAQVAQIEYETTDTVIEALILESNLIQAYQPKYNVRAKDDKTFLGIYITDEDFPRVFPVRITNKRLPKGEFFGPFTSAVTVRQALKILRRIFPWCNDKFKRRPCLYYHLKQCPGPCAGAISMDEYRKIINRLKMFLRGKKKEVTTEIKKEMKLSSRKQDFENAARLRDQKYALEHIRDINLYFKDEVRDFRVHHFRVEGYDISDVFGTSSVGAMVVFINGKPDSSKYRKFRIRTVKGIDDVAMMIEMIKRRLKHTEWPAPNLIIVDGGVGHYNAVKKLVGSIPLVAIAKGPTRKKSDLFYDVGQLSDVRGQVSDLQLLATQVRDEAHRFAIQYHRQLKRKLTIPKR